LLFYTSRRRPHPACPDGESDGQLAHLRKGSRPPGACHVGEADLLAKRLSAALANRLIHHPRKRSVDLIARQRITQRSFRSYVNANRRKSLFFVGDVLGFRLNRQTARWMGSWRGPLRDACLANRLIHHPGKLDGVSCDLCRPSRAGAPGYDENKPSPKPRRMNQYCFPHANQQAPSLDGERVHHNHGEERPVVHCLLACILCRKAWTPPGSAAINRGRNQDIRGVAQFG
jgi:hypothetical protein